MLEQILQKLMDRKDLSASDVAEAMAMILQGAESHQIAAFLALLRAKGETADEILGIVQTMQKNMLKLDVAGDAMDIVGTGGDGKKSVNISTASAILAASCGVKIVKHGNGSVSSLSGSADVLRELGIDINLTPANAKKCFEEVGITFCFAPIYHPLMVKVKEARKGLHMPTIFNALGPLTNPAQVSHFLMGVFDEKLMPLAAKILLQMQVKRAYVVHGAGFDELTTVAPSK